MTTTAVVLAAGKGTRFRSERAKVLHPAAGRTVLRWVLDAVRPLGCARVVVVVGHQADAVRAEAAAAQLDGLVVVEQAEQRGTGHAMRVAAEAGALDACDTVLILPGDAPLLDVETLRALLDGHAGAATLLTAHLPDPSGYGRVLRGADGAVLGIVEHRDATSAQRAIHEVGTSIYAFARGALVAELARLRADNDQGEEYLTDVIAPLARAGGVGVVSAAAAAVAGTNDRAELAAAAAVLRARILDDLMRAGVTVVDPATTYVDAGIPVAPDAILLPGTHLEGATSVEAGACIGPSTRLCDTTVGAGATVTFAVCDGAVIGPGVTVGPYASLRPGTRLERGAKAGTFVELKNTVVGEGSKVPHLAYMGDTEIGRDANVGAGAISVNYDGVRKHRTVIGDGARVGSDTMLVAPVTIGRRAWTGAGSTITMDVPDGALAVERAEQRTVPGYDARKRPEPASEDSESSEKDG